MDEALDVLAGRGASAPRHAAAARLPVPDEAVASSSPSTTVFVVEQNRDAQMRTLLVNELGDRPGPAGAGAALRRHADHRALHRRAISRELHPDDASCRSGRWCHDLHRQAQAAPPRPAQQRARLHPRDYEGAVSTLCAGCGHDSISAAIIQACFELDLPPHRVAKLSGIGCSSKTPTTSSAQSHGFNSVHGRMPSVLTGANLANRDLIYLGVSGDGDSASIGLGQFAHAIRRGVNMVYIVENNGVYGLTKGQFSATADKGSKSKRARQHRRAHRPRLDGAAARRTFVARSFSGDKRSSCR
jgi:hypothetical protein